MRACSESEELLGSNLVLSLAGCSWVELVAAETLLIDATTACMTKIEVLLVRVKMDGMLKKMVKVIGKTIISMISVNILPMK
jgi:hypothetical protein